MADIIPDSHANRLTFFTKAKTEIADNAATLGLDAAAIAAANAILDPLIAAYQTLVDAEDAATQASADADQVFSQQNTALRALFNNIKNNPKCTDGIIAAMQIATPATQHNADDTKPTIKAVAQPGHVRITGSKDYAELVNIYSRILGTAAWVLVGIKRKKFPFDDQTPLKTPGVPEQREYMARGVINDEEVGQPSDIVSVVFAG